MAMTASGEPFGQLLSVGIEGTRLTPEVKGWLARTRPGGIILFKRNVSGLADLASLCEALHAAVDPPPLLAIDEEGGRVSRLTPHVGALPPAASMASAGPARLREYWHRYGDLLRRIGIDVDFAPVVDLCRSDAPNGIADRSYGTDPRLVTECAAAAAEGLAQAGVLPTLKHFPGLGDTLLDSHHHLPSVQKGREAFEREDLHPFACLAAEAPAVMIGHGHYPFYTGPDPLAATLSKEIASRLLRGRLGFAGAAISDDLEMKAVAARVPWDELAPRAVEAGCDMVLICHRMDRAADALEALRRRAASDPAFARRCEEAAERVAALRRKAQAAGARAAPTGRIEDARLALLEAVSSLSGGTAG